MTDSDEIRRRIAQDCELDPAATPRFTNNHAWALVRLQQEDLIQKLGLKEYRLPFTEEKIGTGAAKRAFAPSLDKINPEKPYTVDNCRLVMVAVNFALNAWGDEVRLKLARAAIEAAEFSELTERLSFFAKRITQRLG